VRDYFLDDYLNDIKVLKDETEYRGLNEKRIKTYLVLVLLIFNLIHCLYLLFFDVDPQERIVQGDITSLMGDKSVYTFIMILIFCFYGTVLFHLFHFNHETSFRSFKWVQILDCLAGNLAPEYLDFLTDEKDKMILKKGESLEKDL